MYPSLANHLSDNYLQSDSATDSSSDNLEYSSFDEDELEIIEQLLSDQRSNPASFITSANNQSSAAGEAQTQGVNPQHDRQNESIGAEDIKLPTLPLSVEASGPILIQYEELRGQDKSLCPESAAQEELSIALRNDLQKTPFERFRALKKGLSVTDLVSNMWCEKQFEFYLTTGKKKTTPAMTKGSTIHENLQKEIHVLIPVDTVTEEDRWGRKLVNIIQGLKSLNEGGLTRELPVFAFVDDYFIQGIIDEISYTKPEDYIGGIVNAAVGGKAKGEKSPRKRGLKKENLPPSFGEKVDFVAKDIKAQRTAYITDCKTRVSHTLPTPSQYRAAELQLMLYHLLLASMLSPKNGSAYPSPIERVATLFKLDVDKPFSDTFIEQMESFFEEVEPPHSVSIQGNPTVLRFPALPDIRSHNSLKGFWKLVQDCVPLAISHVGTTMAVAYRSQESESMLAKKTFEYDVEKLDHHLEDVMRWWRGEREAIGVSIEEAWKCRSCEFAENCGWRLEKVAQLYKEKYKRKKEQMGGDKQKRSIP